MNKLPPRMERNRAQRVARRCSSAAKERFVKRLLMTATALVVLPMLGAARCSAQSMDDLNLQIHGYATQGFVYSTNNNWNTTESTDGSAAWTEAVLNITAQPQSRLRFGVQARYYLLGSYGNQITLDWAEADIKINERFGFRVGKVKTPAGLLNETQDIDPAHLWILLPQSVYPIASRNSVLAHFGAVGYGTVQLGESFGRLNYRAYGGARAIGGDDGYLQPFRDVGMTLPKGLTGRMFGGTLRWDTPLRGLTLETSLDTEVATGDIEAGPYRGTFSTSKFHPTYYSAVYQRNKIMFAAEYNRVALLAKVQFPGAPASYQSIDERAFYVMGSYKMAEKLTGGMYYSSGINKKFAVGNARYQKDWVVSGRYDFNPFLYLKVEQHFVDGTGFGYSTLNNTGGLKPDSRMTLLKLGVSF